MNENARKYTLTVRELSDRIGVSLPTAYDLTEIQGFPLLRIGRKKLIPIEALEQWLSENAGKKVL